MWFLPFYGWLVWLRMISRFIHVVEHQCTSFLGWETFLCVYVSQFGCPLVCWWIVELLYVLAIVNGTAVNMGVYMFLRHWFQFFWVTWLETFLNNVVILFFVFWGNTILFFIIAVPFYIPTDNVQGFPFVQTLTNTYFLYFIVAI
jgi:hypothetical protein